jgi:hypothetical protein
VPAVLEVCDSSDIVCGDFSVAALEGALIKAAENATYQKVVDREGLKRFDHGRLADEVLKVYEAALKAKGALKGRDGV